MNVAGQRWKKVAALASDQHLSQGGSLVLVYPEAIDHLYKKMEGVDRPKVVHLAPDEDVAILKGRQLSEKAIKTYAWHFRKKRALQRLNAVLWSYYDPDEKHSVLGYGALVPTRVANRMEHRKPTIEVGAGPDTDGQETEAASVQD